MAITLTQGELSAALRLGDSPEETAESARLLTYVTEAISRHLGDAYATAPDAIVEEAAIRLGAYLFDAPNAGRGLTYANAGRNSGAWAILLPFRVHRAGSTGEAVAAAQEAVGSPGNPVTNVAISGGNLVVTFNDGTTRDEPLPAGMAGDGTDQTARDAAAAAQGTADNAATAATAAADTANANTGRLDAFPAGTGGVDQTARDAADGAQTAADGAQADIADHERTPHNTDGPARTAASAAQGRADDAFALADEKVDASGAATAAREVTSDWAEEDNPDPIPAPKLINVVNAHEDIVNVLDGRLPGLPVAMRLGWSQSRMFTELDFDRPVAADRWQHCRDVRWPCRAAVPAWSRFGPDAFFGIWLAGDPDVAELPAGIRCCRQERDHG